MLVSNGYRSCFHVGKAAGACSLSLASKVKVKTGGTIFPFPHFFMAWHLIN
jgi:hypothetical protein